MKMEKRWKANMRVEIIYEDGVRESVEGDTVMVFNAADEAAGYRPRLAVSGPLDVRALYGLLILLDMQVADDPDALDTAIDTWRENRERLLQEAIENRKEDNADE